ncbi:MAG: carbamoyltransferase HypF [Nitrospinae bacterium]|nr:carbamoyltransferase HypF [Nitrospinota bacterium]
MPQGDEPTGRRLVKVTGIVQGVGFRPFVYNLALGLNLSGHVFNHSAGVDIEVEGTQDSLARFETDLTRLAPPLAHIISVTSAVIPPTGDKGFRITESDSGGAKTALIAPDSDVCEDCLRELFDPVDRRHRYPFINCTNCGPRFTIVEAIPYDRPNTTMASFVMCADCRAEYENPADRRFHAQPIACPVCGPKVTLLDSAFNPVEATDAVRGAARLLSEGAILAIKGIGGYHLACDAENEEAVLKLRARKRRDEKPFAVMTPDIETLRLFAEVNEREAAILQSRPHPITLVKKLQPYALGSCAPSNRYLGAMLPYSPLHHLLFNGRPYNALVMTSANLSDEPIVYTEDEAKEKLAGIADYFLIHNRPIHNKADDSIEKVMSHGPVVIRRSRGYTPVPIQLDREYPPTLAVGAELKNAFCLIKGDKAYLSAHMGDLKYESALESFRFGVSRLMEILDISNPAVVAHDMHPNYLSTAFAEEFPCERKVAVQHHHAHLVSLMAERHHTGQAIGVVFDGTGYGLDGTIWGGEFLVGDAAGFERHGTITPIPLIGGDAAIKEPYRIALGILFGMYGENLPPLPIEWLNNMEPARLALLRQAYYKKINVFYSSGMGRLFDAVSALIGVRPKASFEGQSAMELEMAVANGYHGEYPFIIGGDVNPANLDFTPTFERIVEEMKNGERAPVIAARFHETVAQSATAMVKRISGTTGLKDVFLSGGVFQNTVLSDRLGTLLETDGFAVFRHGRVPPNDGGVALGQAVIAARTLV